MRSCLLSALLVITCYVEYAPYVHYSVSVNPDTREMTISGPQQFYRATASYMSDASPQDVYFGQWGKDIFTLTITDTKTACFNDKCAPCTDGEK